MMNNATESYLTSNISNLTSDQNVDLARTIIIGVFGTLLGIFICVGNVLVLLAVASTPSLQTTTNYLIVNLACADLCLGSVILPLTTLTYVYRVWPFGTFLCTLWQVLDITLTSASILTLGGISIDRYISLTKPLHYNSLVTTKKTILGILIIWIWSLGFALPLVFKIPSNQNNEDKCESVREVGFVIFSVLVTFYIPTVIVLGMYVKIYRIARAQYKRDLANFMCVQKQDISNSTNGSWTEGNGQIATCVNQNETSTSNSLSNGTVDESEDKRVSRRDANKPSVNAKIMHRIKSENKTLKTLGKVVGLFIFCWLPFFAIFPFAMICPTCGIPEVLIDVVFWLGYCNSMVNPVIYALSTSRFRNAFLRLMRCRVTQNKTSHD